MSRVRTAPRPPTLSQRHMDLHVWSHPRHSYIFHVSSKSVQGYKATGVNICHFPLLWLLDITTASTVRYDSYDTIRYIYVRSKADEMASLI